MAPMALWTTIYTNSVHGCAALWEDIYHGLQIEGRDGTVCHPKSPIGVVKLSSNGFILAIGSSEPYQNSTSTVYVKKLIYSRDYIGWNKLGYEIPVVYGGDNDYGMGNVIELSADGTRLAIGFPSHLVDNVNAGLVRIYS